MKKKDIKTLKKNGMDLTQGAEKEPYGGNRPIPLTHIPVHVDESSTSLFQNKKFKRIRDLLRGKC